MDIQQFDNRLACHDWYHAWSDDHSIWARGEDNYSEIKYLASESPAHEALFKAYSKHYFTGAPWNTPHFTREQLDVVRRELGVIQKDINT